MAYTAHVSAELEITLQVMFVLIWLQNAASSNMIGNADLMDYNIDVCKQYFYLN